MESTCVRVTLRWLIGVSLGSPARLGAGARTEHCYCNPNSNAIERRGVSECEEYAQAKLRVSMEVSSVICLYCTYNISDIGNEQPLSGFAYLVKLFTALQ